MPFPTKVDLTNKGVIRRFELTDDLEVDGIVRRSGSGNMTIGANLGATEELILGSSTSDVRVLGDMIIDGSETVSTDETITGTFNANGDANLGNNSGDTVNLGGGTSDIVNLNADLVVGAGTITIGSSVTDFVDAIFLDAVNANGPALAAYDLNASGTNAGAYAIGVDPSLIANSISTDLMTMLANMDAAISAASSTLQQAYVAGSTIDVTTANGTIDFSNDTTSDTTTVLRISRAPSAGTGGIGLDISMGANAQGAGINVTHAGSGDALFVNNTGSGNAIDIQDGGTSVFRITDTGAVFLVAPLGKNLNLQSSGSGIIAISSGAGNITVDTNASISLDADGVSNFTTTSGNLTLDSTTGELVLDDTGSSSTTLSQAADRTFDLTATDEPLNGATSLLGAINRLARRMADDGILQTERAIENGVTIAAGDIIAASTVAGRVTQNNDNAETRSAVIGVALTGGLGDVGGTVFTRFFLPGAVVTDAGATFTAGNELFAPDGTGRATGTAPANNGDRVTRVGYAISATEYVFNPVEGFVL